MPKAFTQTENLICILFIFTKYSHNLESSDGYIEITPKNWRKVSKEDKLKLKLFNFNYHPKLKQGYFRLDHFELSTPDGLIFS